MISYEIFDIHNTDSHHFDNPAYAFGQGPAVPLAGNVLPLNNTGVSRKDLKNYTHNNLDDEEDYKGNISCSFLHATRRLLISCNDLFNRSLQP